ncbi:MAG: glycosyltransferase [Ferruginibacter sp.]
MKIYIVGSDKVYAIENFYVRYLRELGVEVFHFPAQSIFYDYYHKNIFNKVIFKAGLSQVIKQIASRFKKTVETFRPDVIWVFKGMELAPETLRWAKQKGIKLVNFNGDSPFVFSGKGSGNSYVSDSIPLYDLHLTYNSWVKNKMEATFHIPAEILPFGFDIPDELYRKCTEQKEVVKACFLGNPDKHRGDFLQQLAAEGVELDVYGNFWNNYLDHKNIKVFEPAYGDDFWLTLRRYRVQLNLMRPHNPDTHNMRSFEVPGVGGIQLATDTDDHKTYFTPGSEIFIYKDLGDCVTQVRKILALSQSAADAVRQNARERSLDSGYTYKARAAQALEKISKVYYV